MNLGGCPRLTCPLMTAICLWNWPLSKPGSFCKGRVERRWNLHESLRRTHFSPLVRHLLLQKTYTRLMRLSEVNYYPRTLCFTPGEIKYSEYLVLSLIINSKQLQALMLHLKMLSFENESSEYTLQPHDTQDTYTPV